MESSASMRRDTRKSNYALMRLENYQCGNKSPRWKARAM
jgi:hypothetical protein